MPEADRKRDGPIWIPGPEQIAATNLHAFLAFVRARGVEARDPNALHEWSVGHPAAFWDAVWQFTGVIGERGDGPALLDGDRMPGARWFPGARLNFAENLLRVGLPDPALIACG